MTTAITARRITLSALLLAATTLMAPAQALEPTVPATSERALLREASGNYELDDGRSVKVSVGQTRLGVSINEQPAELWRAQGVDLLVSPDGMRRLRLLRNSDGSVDRIALETDRLK